MGDQTNNVSLMYDEQHKRPKNLVDNDDNGRLDGASTIFFVMDHQNLAVC